MGRTPSLDGQELLVTVIREAKKALEGQPSGVVGFEMKWNGETLSTTVVREGK